MRIFTHPDLAARYKCSTCSFAPMETCKRAGDEGFFYVGSAKEHGFSYKFHECPVKELDWELGFASDYIAAKNTGLRFFCSDDYKEVKRKQPLTLRFASAIERYYG